MGKTAKPENDSWKYSSGDEEIDQIREELKEVSRTRDNFAVRILLMKNWAAALQQQCADLGERYMEVDRRLANLSVWNPIFHGKEDPLYSDEGVIAFGKVIEEGFSVLAEVQKRLVDNPATSFPTVVGNAVNKELQGRNIDWPNYKGNQQHTGFSGADGPVHGRTVWKFPVGLAWESKPVVDGRAVYLASPGMRNIMWKLELNTGQVLDVTRQLVRVFGDQLYSVPCLASTPVILEEHILLREMGSRGNRGDTKHVVYIDKKTGEIDRKIYSGHVDYRAGYAPFAANEKYLIVPLGVQDIEGIPPVCQPFNRIVCKDTVTGEPLWDFNVGPTFAEPVLEGEHIFIGTRAGYIYCLKAGGRYSPASSERIAWEFKAKDAINRRVEVDKQHVYFGSNDGTVYCLDKVSGKLVWSYQITAVENRAFRQFSSPLAHEGKLFIGGADKNLYCLHTSSGELLFQSERSDWIRSQPVAQGDYIYVASIDGVIAKIDCVEKAGKVVWEKRIGKHWVYADLEVAGDRILLNDSDLYCYCLDPKGKVLWRHSLIKGFVRDGSRVFTDQIAGGAYYQSKPTAAFGLIYVGTPSRFVYALDAESGAEKWKFELGAAVSGAPIYDQDKIYIGQQGGEDDFYCLNARSGELIWRQNVGWVWGSANVSDNLVFIPSVDGYVNCLDAKSGHIVWRYRTERSTCSEPLVIGDHVFFGGWDHYLYKFDKRSGELIWKYQLNGGSDSGSPISAEGMIFLPVAGSTFRCLDPESKEVIWTPRLEYKMFNVTPAYNDGKVFISTLNGVGLGGIPVAAQVFAIDSRDGGLIWTFNGGGGLTGPVVGNNGRVYFGSTVNSCFFCVDADGNGDGTTDLLWSIRMENKTEESVPAIYKGKVYILNSGGYLHAIE